MSVYDTVISSRIRLARNVNGLNFPGNFKKYEHAAILPLLRPDEEGYALARLPHRFRKRMRDIGIIHACR